MDSIERVKNKNAIQTELSFGSYMANFLFLDSKQDVTSIVFFYVFVDVCNIWLRFRSEILP